MTDWIPPSMAMSPVKDSCFGVHYFIKAELQMKAEVTEVGDFTVK